jgi:hypothetical protein
MDRVKGQNIRKVFPYICGNLDIASLQLLTVSLPFFFNSARRNISDSKRDMGTKGEGGPGVSLDWKGERGRWVGWQGCKVANGWVL